MRRDTLSLRKWLRTGTACGLAAVLLLAVGCGRSDEPEESADREADDPAAVEQQQQAFERQFRQLLDGEADTDRLLGEMEAFVEAHPDYYPGRRLYAQALQIAGQPNAAYEQFEAAVQLEPDDAELRLLVGDTALHLGKPDHAQRHYARGADLEPDRERFKVRLAQALIEQQRYDEARRLLLEALRRDSSLHRAHIALSDLYARQNEQDMALEHVERAIDLVPDDEQRRRTGYVLRLSALLRRANRPDEALAVLRDLPAEQQVQIPTAQAMAACWAMLDQPEQAAEHFDYMLSRDPSDDLAAAEAANWHLRAGQLDKAQQRVEVLRQINPRSPSLPRLEEALAEATADADRGG